MAEAVFKESLAELENKAGRKTPESLLSWMRDAADRGDQALSCDAGDGGDPGSALGDSVSAKINHLKEEMRRLRCADVSILWQLMRVHEGIEAMRWLMEDSGALASRGSSLSGSLSSLVTVEEHGPWTEIPSPTWPQVWTEKEPEPERLQRSLSDDGDSTQESYMSTLNPKSEDRHPRPSSFKFRVSLCISESRAQASTNAASDLSAASLEESQTHDLEATPLKSFKTYAQTIKMALLRSSRVRKEVTARTSSSIFTTQSEETQREHQTHESVGAPLDNTSSVEEDLLHQEDVTFL